MPVQSNLVFVRVPADETARWDDLLAADRRQAYLWKKDANGDSTFRFACAWQTSQKDIEQLVRDFYNIVVLGDYDRWGERNAVPGLA